MPEFLISKSAFSKFIEHNLQYPDSSYKQGIQGKVIIGFIVNKDSSLSDFHIIKGINKQLNEEALRLAQMVKKAAPGTIDNKKVKVILSLPIRFRIDDTESGVHSSNTGIIPGTPYQVPFDYSKK